jgi:branched-chain amino acid aminotransferase
VTEGLFFRLDEHLDRFETSCHKTRIALPILREGIKRVVAECAQRSKLKDACVFLCGKRAPFRRGEVLILCGARQSNKRAPASVSPKRAAREYRNRPNSKKFHLTKGTFEAWDHGVDAAILLSIKGYVTEGPDFNIWIARGDSLVTSRLQARGAFKEIMRCVLDRGPCQ